MDEMKSKLLIISVDGYSSSVRETKLRHIIYSQLDNINKKYNVNYNKNFIYRNYDARFSSSKKRELIKVLKKHSDPNTFLLFIGKSYGAKVAEKIFNSVRLTYKKICLVTIDPCWPKFFNWTPNCNNDSLFFKSPMIDEIFNMYLVMDKNKQCGSPVYSLYKDVVVNNHKFMSCSQIKGEVIQWNHKNIIEHDVVGNVIRSFLIELLVQSGLSNGRKEV